ncbi:MULTISPECIES: multidrug efflux SMR transporter [Ferrimonas]|uniref:DMT family transporter n=1 Tax=Ferrimonas TaxID=44011 RepID=UPI0004196E5F|nr:MULTISPECIES: multidrug efflux SMR transporter [Ferrimonas]USD38500.1 multidrug efflux SMR transporter [Ferrimonas sp. SCSIO 43195]
MAYLCLLVAIIAEVSATSLLPRTQGFTQPLPTLLCLCGYLVAFALLAQVVRVMPVGIAYAIWCGAGIVLVAGVGWWRLKQPLDAAAMLGMGLIVAGTLIIHLFSRSVQH